jgi:hypothetical protein
MSKPIAALAIAVLPLLAGGCIAKTALDIATMPVKAGAQAADWATTSQDEADRNYGRKMREQEAKDGRAQKKAEEERRKREADAENDD